jgi:hypothetical protein
MDTVQTYETLVNSYQSTRRYNPEDSHLHSRRRENLKSYPTASHLKSAVKPTPETTRNRYIKYTSAMDYVHHNVLVMNQPVTTTTNFYSVWVTFHVTASNSRIWSSVPKVGYLRFIHTVNETEDTNVPPLDFLFVLTFVPLGTTRQTYCLSYMEAGQLEINKKHTVTSRQAQRALPVYRF